MFNAANVGNFVMMRNSVLITKYIFRNGIIGCGCRCKEQRRLASRLSSAIVSDIHQLNGESRSDPPQEVVQKKRSFDELMTCRRAEAQRSVLVELPAGITSVEDVWRECALVGDVKTMMRYTMVNKEKETLLLLLEFTDKEAVCELIKHGGRINSSTLPIRSPFLHFSPRYPSTQDPHLVSTSSKSSTASMHLTNSVSSCQREAGSMPVLHKEKKVTEAYVVEQMINSSSISEQIQKYYDLQRLSELGWRLRFFTCRQVEWLLAGMFPYAAVLPFGSSVNGFGRDNSDLDFILELGEENEARGAPPARCPGLVFQSNNSHGWGGDGPSGRQQVQRHMDVTADLLYNFAPGCVHVRKILNARVPIIKYKQHLTGLECDLSMSNRSGLYMSEMLYQYGELEPRFGPLVFAVRLWAKRHHLTSLQPGRWISNFSLTVLVLFYLIKRGLLPPFKTFVNNARPEDHRTAEDELDCTFLRDVNLLSQLWQPKHEDESLEVLLYGFFEYYDEFSFKTTGLSLVSGHSFTKPNSAALYIQNPLDVTLNVTRNVTLEEVDRLNTALREARYLLQAELEAPPRTETGAAVTSPWGLLSLFPGWGGKTEHFTNSITTIIQEIFTSKDTTTKHTKPSSSTARLSKVATNTNVKASTNSGIYTNVKGTINNARVTSIKNSADTTENYGGTGERTTGAAEKKGISSPAHTNASIGVVFDAVQGNNNVGNSTKGGKFLDYSAMILNFKSNKSTNKNKRKLPPRSKFNFKF